MMEKLRIRFRGITSAVPRANSVSGVQVNRLLYVRQMPLALAKSAQYYPIVMPRTTGGTAEVPPPVQSFLDADRHEARLLSLIHISEPTRPY